MGAIKADGMLNRAQMQYNGKFQMTNDDQKDMKQNTRKDSKNEPQMDSGMWTGVLVNDSVIPMTFQSVVKSGPDKGMVQSGVVVLDKTSLKGMLVQATGVTLPFYAQMNGKDRTFTFTMERGKTGGNGTMMSKQEGYAGTFQGPKGDKGEWQALYLTF